jgi:hypothetical protein
VARRCPGNRGEPSESLGAVVFGELGAELIRTKLDFGTYRADPAGIGIDNGAANCDPRR